MKAGCIINKSDLNIEVTDQILEFLRQEEIIHITNLPYDDTFTAAITDGKTIVEYNNGTLRKLLEDSCYKIKQELKN